MDIRTDRLGLLVDQLESSLEFSLVRMEGISDEEYIWEPVPGCWSIWSRGQARTSRAFGPGEWVLDHDNDPDPGAGDHDRVAARPPAQRVRRAVGVDISAIGRLRRPMSSTSPSASGALEQFWSLMARWRDSVDA